MPSYDRRDPAKAYDQVMGDIRKVLRGLEQKLRTHENSAKEGQNAWGHVGDVTEVLKRLQEISDFLANEK